MMWDDEGCSSLYFHSWTWKTFPNASSVSQTCHVWTFHGDGQNIHHDDIHRDDIHCDVHRAPNDEPRMQRLLLQHLQLRVLQFHDLNGMTQDNRQDDIRLREDIQMVDTRLGEDTLMVDIHLGEDTLQVDIRPEEDSHMEDTLVVDNHAADMQEGGSGTAHGVEGKVQLQQHMLQD